MLSASAIDSELHELETRRARPFSRSARRLVLESAEDPRQLIEARLRRLERVSPGGKLTHKRILQRVLGSLDFERYRELQGEILSRPGIRAHSWRIKYLQLDYWLAAKLEIALGLGLHDGAPLSILDLGVGAGHFPYICRLLGHEVLGTDISPLPRHREWPGRHLYDRLIELFGIERRPHAVEAHTPLPDFGRRFDLVSALMVKFDSPERQRAWTPAEWAFFLRDLEANVLRPDGRVFLRLNRPFAGEEIMSFMEACNGQADRETCTVVFAPLRALPA